MDEAEFKTQRSNRDESNLDVEFNDRKFSAASVDVLIGKNSLKPFQNKNTIYIFQILIKLFFSDGLELKRGQEQAKKKEKKRKVYTDQEEIHSQRKLQEQLQNIEPPNCGPRNCNVNKLKIKI